VQRLCKISLPQSPRKTIATVEIESFWTRWLDPPISAARGLRLLSDSRLEPFCSVLRSRMNEPEYASTAAVRNGRNTCAT